MEHRNSYEKYAYLWVDDRSEFLRQFLLYGHVLTPEEVEEAGEDGVPETPPSLDQFNEQVDTFEKIYCEVEQFEVRMFWVRLNDLYSVNYCIILTLHL